MRFESRLHRIAGLACVSLLAACSGVGKNEAQPASHSRRQADVAGAGGLTLKLGDFPQEFQASECAAQAEWRVTLLEGGRETTVLKARMKLGESLKLPTAAAANAKLRMEIHLGKEERAIFRGEVDAPTASKGLYQVRLAFGDKGQAVVTLKEGAKEPEASSEKALSIWGGTEPSASILASTVFLRKEGSMCSGAVLCGPDGKIDPEHTWVLTAAHCMTPVSASFGPEGFSSTRRCAARGPAVSHPEFKNGSSHDIAVVQFQCPASALVGAACVRPWTLPLAAGEQLIFAGYGKRSSTLGPGKLLEARASVLAESATAGSGSPYSGLLGGPTGGGLVSRGAGSSVCPGDSGGPSYYIRNGATYVAGVHITGSCDHSTPTPMVTDAGVAAHSSWIFSVIGGSGGHVPGPAQPTSPPAGGGGTAPAGGAIAGGQTSVPSGTIPKAGSLAGAAAGASPDSAPAPEGGMGSESAAAGQESSQPPLSCPVPTAK